MEAQRVLRLGLEQGMMNGKVLDFAQDAKGRIWMATEGGLHCWDGFSFTIYTTANSGLAENQLNAVLADADGEHLWIGTQHDGLCRLHIPSGKWETWKAADGLLADGITHIEADPLGGIWITYYLSGVDFRATNGSLIHYDASTVKGLEGTNWTAITNGKRQLYIGHVAQGLSVIDLKTRRHTSYVHQPSDPHSIMNNSVRSLCRDAKGLVWVGTEQGVSVFNPESGRFIRHIPTASQVTALLPLNDGNVLIGELNRGEHAMFQDRAGNIWKSDGRQGVRVYCHERLPFEYIDTTFTAVTMPGFDMVQDTCKSPSGYWVATPNGLWHVDAQGVKTEMTAINRQLQVKNINSLCTDRRGRCGWEHLAPDCMCLSPTAGSWLIGRRRHRPTSTCCSATAGGRYGWPRAMDWHTTPLLPTRPSFPSMTPKPAFMTLFSGHWLKTKTATFGQAARQE